MINYQCLDVEYDSVVVFDLLSQEERDQYKISSSLEDLFIKNNTHITVKYFVSKQEVLTFLKELLKEVESGMKFMFHFVGHGNKECIAFKHTFELITWVDLTSILSDINVASGNTLVLNMTSCFGLHCIKTVNPFSDGNPFFGLIGYSNELNVEVAIKANDIFYSSLMGGMKINNAVSKLQADLDDKNFHCISSQGYSYLKKLKL